MSNTQLIKEVGTNSIQINSRKEFESDELGEIYIG
jgi:hypothetical protein